MIIIKYKTRDDKIGEISLSKFGTPIQLIEYRNVLDCDVQFQDEYKYVSKHVAYNNFIQGKIKNPYDKSIHGVAMLGDGKHRTRFKNGKHTKIYYSWNDMIIRSYINKEKYPTYYEITTVCDEWLNFQNFAQWYEDNSYPLPNDERLHLDKDIMVAGNKHYSPGTCLLVPQKINMLFTNLGKDDGLPNGIRKTDNGKKFTAMYNHKHLGCFVTLKEAYEYYAKEKETAIKQRAEEYKTYIPSKLYDALLNYQVKMEHDKNYEENI